MSPDLFDTGMIAFVVTSERVDRDQPDDPDAASDATEGGPDDALADVYTDPGVIILSDLG